MRSDSSSSKSAWVQLYEARKASFEMETRPPGRPPAPIPRKKVGITLSQGEISELEVWQERLSALLERKVSIGETIGILTRICSARSSRLANRKGYEGFEDLAELVSQMVG
ncbi:MAG: hypothetical protein GYA17_09170 [Chloroflexi bacterium]|jgi:hypothetical protein|nr:hypothetical protein [Anaerolineaceae bacterium]NMB88519.1 hypothetical protein [Chloroflexota bacterium]